MSIDNLDMNKQIENNGDLTERQIGTGLLHSCCGAGCFLGGFLHIPVATAIVKSNLQNFWKFLGLSIVAGDGMECIKIGVGEFRKAVEAINSPEKEPEQAEENEPETENATVEEIFIDPHALHEVKPETEV